MIFSKDKLKKYSIMEENTWNCTIFSMFRPIYVTLCSTLVIRPRLNSAKGYFSPKSGLSYVFVYDLIIYDHFLSTLWVFCRKKF